MHRSFVDAAEAKRVMADAGILQLDGAHNANATAKEAWKVTPELLVQHAINTAYSRAAGMPDELIALSEGAETPQATVKYLRMATQVPDPAAASKMFTMVLEGGVRSQDSFWILALLLGHRENGVLIWSLMRENWDEMIAVLPALTGRRILDLAQYRSEPDVAASIHEWFDDHTLAGGEKFIQQRLELLDVRVALREREANALSSV